MEQQRLLLTLGLLFLLYLAYGKWQEQFNPQANVPAPTQVTQPAADNSSIPESASSIPEAVTTPSAIPAETKSQAGSHIKSAKRIYVETKALKVEIDALGGDVRVLDLLEYPETNDKDSKPFRLLTDSSDKLFIAQSGFAAKRAVANNSIVTAPNHKTVYKIEKDSYQLKNGDKAIRVKLFWLSPENILFTKIYEFKPDSYDIKVIHRVENRNRLPWHGNLYQQLQRKDYKDEKQSSFIHTYTGGVIYSNEEKYEKINFSDMEDENLKRDIKGGWAAIIQHYFLAAWIPPAESTQTYYSRDLGNQLYLLGMKASKEMRVNGGESKEVVNTLYAGPKIQKHLEELAPGLELTVDYGMLTFIAKPIFWLMTVIHSVVNNWGWSIILLTLMIKLLFYKLSEASYKSMANMRKVQPRMAALKERYGDDRQKMNQAMMKMYKEEKINPLGGCLPILVQIPVFIALYWVLLESVELRQADWILWYTDLSTKDPYFILPLLMGISMFIQQKLNPAPIDPMQARIMSALPFVFTVFFAFFPSGLVLYWVVNNTLSIAQQWYITRHVVKA